MGYIPEQSLENLKRYSYKTANTLFLSRDVTGRFGRWSVALCPPFIAPNTITLIGLCLIVLNFLTLIYYDPLYLVVNTDVEVTPQWIYYTWGLGLLAYLILDEMDGAQARRTGMASPLGELFDHGCDAISTTLVVILAAHALGLGRNWWTVVGLIATHANFYLTIWAHYYTDELMLGYISDPIEGRLVICMTFFFSGHFGPSFWTQHIWTVAHLEDLSPFNRLPNLALNKLFRIFRTSGLVLNFITSCLRVHHANRHEKPASLRGPFLRLVNFLFFIFLQVSWLSHPTINNWNILYSPVFLPFLCLWGLQFAHFMGRIILARVTMQPFPVWEWTWVWSVIGAIDANLSRLNGMLPIIQRTQYRTTIFIWLALIASFITYARFVILVINDMTEFLGIGCFTVRKRDEKGYWVNAGQNEVEKKKN